MTTKNTMKTITATLILLVQVFSQHKVRYDDYRVYRVLPNTQEDVVNMLKDLEQDSDLYVWTNVRNRRHPVDVIVPPRSVKKFENIMSTRRLDSNITIPNVQRLIDNKRGRVRTHQYFGWTQYYSLEKINRWLSNLARRYSDKVTLIKGGTSYEGRDILGVHVSFAPGNSNRSVFIEGNIHACEWISSSVVTYILNQLLTSSNTSVRKIAASHDWYFFPVINVDGFAYSHSRDRLWRKTRVPYGRCIGADPNRNWGYHFNNGGTSNNPCADIYRGPRAFSEPSTRSLSQFIASIGPRLEGYIAFHSYGQTLLIPYGYTPRHLDNYGELYQVGLKAIRALSRRYGTHYRIGNVAETLYAASGGSPDWVKGTFGTRITYTYELRDTGEYGVLLPAHQILPTAEETFDSFITIFQEFAKRK